MKRARRNTRRMGMAAALAGSVALLSAPTSYADDGPHLDDGVSAEQHLQDLFPRDPDAHLSAHDAATANIVSDGPAAKVIKNLAVAGRGERISPDGTTDVWAHAGYAYTGTFNSPCGGEQGAGVWVWDVHNKNFPTAIGIIDSPVGSRSNDVKVATMNSGDVLVHSNESCGGGPGGFEIYSVNDPYNPVHMASVTINELNPISDALFGGINDAGVHNLFLFKQGGSDYVGVVSEGAFDNFRIYDITDPSNPILVTGWGAEEIFDPGVGNEVADISRVLNAALWLTDGFGASRNRFLHDVTVSADGTKAYLANWDAGLVLLDISDPANPAVVSVALDPVNGSLDGEVNSHSVWPSEDGRIVVEGEEDFNAWEASAPPGNVTFGNGNPIPGVIASTAAGDAFEGSQTGNAGSITASSVVVTSGPLAGTSFPANGFGGDNFPLGESAYAGNFVWIGQACNGDPILNVPGPGDIAVVRRGACTFAEKSVNASNAGAGAIVVTNNNPTSTPWSGLRIWDYSDPANPVLASLFDTACSAATAPGGNCDSAGTYSSHNVIVETQGNTVKAYISWYWDGVVVVDVTDPYNPVETARYSRTDAEFKDSNGGPQDVWGIHKEPGQPWIYASDRNGGLYILKEYGAGSGGNAAKNGK